MGKKGLSLEEKRAKMLELFYEKKCFFQMKELEKLGPKEKGVVGQSVKEVVQSLVDDNLVDAEKIGTYMCYWAFPSKAANNRQTLLNKIETETAELEKKIVICEQTLAEARTGKDDTPERTELLEQVRKLQSENEAVLKQISALRDNDPEVLATMQLAVTQANTDANRWTDNVFAIKQWCKRKFSLDSKQIDKQFGIPEDLDYVD